MKCIKTSLLSLAILLFSALCAGEEAVDSSVSAAAVESDIAQDNPFLNGEAGGSEDMPEFFSENSSGVSYETANEIERNHEWLIDISAGGVLTRYEPGANTTLLETAPSSSLFFDAGIDLRFLNYFYTSVSCRYLHLCFDVNRLESEEIGLFENSTISDIRSTEELHYVTVPFSFGMRFQIGSIAPYIFGEIEPALLVGAHLHSRTELTTEFENGAELSKKYASDSDVLEYREDKQLFYGGGVGIDINYGYGVVYLETALKFSLRAHDRSNDPISVPLRGEGSLIYVPITLGLRFFF
jgi:hypothetical protein